MRAKEHLGNTASNRKGPAETKTGAMDNAMGTSGASLMKAMGVGKKGNDVFGSISMPMPASNNIGGVTSKKNPNIIC